MKLLKTFSLYTFVGFLNAGIGFLVLPILTHYLSPADYGIISLMNTYVLILMPIIGLSTASFITVEYHNKKLVKEEFRVLFSSVRVIPLLMLVPFTAIFILGYKFLPDLLELPLDAYWILLPLTLFALYQDNFKSFLVTSKRTYFFSLTTLGKVGLEIPLTILLIAYAGLQWDGRIYGWLITVGLFSFLSLYFYWKWDLLSNRITKTYILQSISFGAPLILHQIGKFVINQSDRLFLVKMVSVKEMGIYSVGYTVASVLLIIITAFTNFFTPFLFQRLNEPTDKNKHEVLKVSFYFLIALIIVLLLMTLLAPYFFHWFINEEYFGAVKYIFWVGLGFVFWGIYNVLSGYIFFMKVTRILAYVAVLNVVLNLTLNFFLIKKYGALGAAYSTCISYFIVAIIVFFIVRKLHPMPWLFFLNQNKI